MGTNKSLIQLIIEAVDKFTPKTNELDKKIIALGNRMQHTGLIMTAGLTVPVVAGFAKMVDAASDMSETVNKVNVVFGEAAQEVLDFGKDAARGLGMSEQKAMEAAGTFGNLFTSMGLAKDQSAEMSTELLTLAADLASFNNIDPTVALEKLRAGLVGEVEPLRTLGVNLSAAAVELKAVELGLIKSGDEMTAAAKAQASYALIMEQTTNAQGDFARTSDGLANSQRILKAELEDVVAEMGQNLLPIALNAVKFLGDLVGKFGDMEPAGQKAVLAFMGVAAALGPILTITGKIITMLPMLKIAWAAALGPVGLAIAGVTAAIGLLIVASEKAADATAPIYEAQAREVAAIGDFKGAVEDGIITGEEYIWVKRRIAAGSMSAADAEEWLAEKVGETTAAISASRPGDEQMIGRHRDGAEAARDHAAAMAEEAVPAVEDYGRAMADLDMVIGGRLGPTIEDFELGQADLETQMGGVETQIDKLRGAAGRWIIDAETGERRLRGLTRTEQEELAELEGQYGDLQQQYQDNATAHEEATRRILFDLLTMRANVDGLTSAEMGLLTHIAESWGLVDDATATAALGFDNALGLLEEGNVAGAYEAVDGIGEHFSDAGIDSGKAITTLVTGPMAAMEAELRDITGLADGLVGTYDMEFNISVTGDPIPSGASSSNNYYGNSYVPQAEGGDWWVTKPTLFLAGEAGPERATFTPEGEEMPSRGSGERVVNVTVNATVTNEIDLHVMAQMIADEIARA